MSDPISAILDVHDSPRTRNDSQGMLLTLAAEQPRQLGELMLQALARRSPGSAFLDMALDLLPDEVVPAVATDAWRRYRDGERGELLAGVIEFASYQAPQVLQDDWDALLGVAIEDELQLASQLWWALPPALAAAWAQTLAEADDDREMPRARALLLAAQPATYAAARGYLADWGRLDAEVWAHWAGVADGPHPRRLHGERPLHIRFGSAQHRAQLADEPGWRKRIWRLHPTWNGGQVHHAGQMGGPLEALCGGCHAPLQRLLQTDAAALQPGATGEITLGLCIGLLWLGRAAGALLSPRRRGPAQLPPQPAPRGAEHAHRQRRSDAGRCGPGDHGQRALAAAGLGSVQSSAESLARGWRAQLGAECLVPGLHRLRPGNAVRDAAGFDAADHG